MGLRHIVVVNEGVRTEVSDCCISRDVFNREKKVQSTNRKIY